jgi:hypothetical protein
MFTTARIFKMSNKLLIPARAAREAIGVKTTKFYQLLSDGKLDARKLGSRTFVTVESLRSFVDNLPRADINLAPRKTSESGNGSGDKSPGLPKPEFSQKIVADAMSSLTRASAKAKGAR